MRHISAQQRLAISSTLAGRLAGNRMSLSISLEALAGHVMDSWGLTLLSAADYLHKLESGDLFYKMKNKVNPMHYQRISDYLAAQGVQRDAGRLLDGLEKLTTYKELPPSAISPIPEK